MEWHDGTERRRFEREQAELRKQYLAAGMTEEQIQALYAFDREWYKAAAGKRYIRSGWIFRRAKMRTSIRTILSTRSFLKSWR